MTSNELYLVLYGWAVLILDPEGSGSPEIIQSHEDSAAPDSNYVTIQYNGSRKKIGRASKTEPDVDGKRKVVNDWEVRLNIWETNGDGDLLNALINAVETIAPHDFLVANCVAYMGEETDVQSLPRLENQRWIKESVVTIRLMIPISVEEESSFISDVNMTGTIPKQAIAGNHIVENT